MGLSSSSFQLYFSLAFFFTPLFSPSHFFSLSPWGGKGRGGDEGAAFTSLPIKRL